MKDCLDHALEHRETRGTLRSSGTTRRIAGTAAVQCSVTALR